MAILPIVYWLKKTCHHLARFQQINWLKFKNGSTKGLQTINANLMRNLLLASILVVFSSLTAYAQDDLMGMLQDAGPQKPTPVFATFKAPRVITGQSVEHTAARHLNFVILHRFGEMNGGAYTLFGIDQANIRLAFDYGLTDRIQLGLARSSVGKTYDGSLKVKLLAQSKGKKSMPITLGYYGNVGVNTETWANPNRNNYFTSRLSFFNQINIARKFNDWVSLQVSPTLVHYNLVGPKSYDNMMFALGLSGSIKLSRSVRFNFETYPRLTAQDQLSRTGDKLYNYLALGFDIETGGHVFQLMLSNGNGMLEQLMVRETRTQWADGGIRLGFNVSRTFSFDKKEKSKNW